MPRQRQGQFLQGLEILVRPDLYRHLLVAPPMEMRRPAHRSKALLEDFTNVRFGSEADAGKPLPHAHFKGPLLGPKQPLRFLESADQAASAISLPHPPRVGSAISANSASTSA